jgi:predicted phage terminase large subunit-like protein
MNDALVELARDNLLVYAMLTVPGYKPAAHHKRLAEYLERAESGEVDRFMCNMPPRHGKSKLASEIYPAWYLGRNPGKRVIQCCYGAELATIFGRSVRNLIASEAHQAIFPECQLAADSSSVQRFNTTKEGGYAAVGVGGPITGRGADLLLLDDLTKNRQDADSPTVHTTMIEWYGSVARTRLQSGGSIVGVQTRWGANDFINWLLTSTAHEGWRKLILPALALADDPLGRAIGEPLWPSQYDAVALDNLRLSLGARDWQALYQQDPVGAADVIFEPGWLQFYRETPPKFDDVYQSWDLTFGSTNGNASWVVGQAWGVVGSNKYLIGMSREQLGFSQTLSAIRSARYRFPNTTKIYIEAKANGQAAIETLGHEDWWYKTRIEPILPRGNKEERAFLAVPSFQRGEVFLPDPALHSWIKPLLTELELFPKSATDDCVDAMSQFLGNWAPNKTKWLSMC